jgi:hypothetical protein
MLSGRRSSSKLSVGIVVSSLELVSVAPTDSKATVEGCTKSRPQGAAQAQVSSAVFLSVMLKVTPCAWM